MAIYWSENFENGFGAWETYGLGNNFSISSAFAYDGTKSLYMPRPNGGFIDRFVGLANQKQFNLKYAIYLGSNWVTDVSNSKHIYVRSDQHAEGYPNGVLEFLFGGRTLFFALQGGYDTSDTQNLSMNLTLNLNQWYEIEFEWLMNDPGSANGHMRCWYRTSPSGSWTQTIGPSSGSLYNGREYRGPSSNTVVDNIRLYSQHGSGDIYMDAIVMANQQINDGSAGEPPEEEVPLLPGPSNLQPNSSSPSQPAGPVTVSWNAVPGANGYRLWIHKVGTPYEPESSLVRAADQTGTSYEFEAEPSSSYDWWVKTYNSEDELGEASGALIHIAAAPPPEEEDPEDPPPGNFPATRTVTVNWDAVADSDLAGYRIYQYLPADSTSPTMIEILGQVTTYSVVVPSNIGDAGFEISSFDAVGNESAKSTKIVVTVDPPTAPPADTTPPAVPSNVAGSSS
jgi:hypothetical protein